MNVKQSGLRKIPRAADIARLAKARALIRETLETLDPRSCLCGGCGLRVDRRRAQQVDAMRLASCVDKIGQVMASMGAADYDIDTVSVSAPC